ncbi:MAG: UDP-N-acetylglucosamine 2-epimerase (non-hydrolyzing) [Firmicutes bacterium HGW-Firmicutes-11]|nr:MAG: UDP-N-acetylglucosamine 2-epimerase (non-hydrolyzing) [Firmicutes bacterium HGW-Firmicutes-11]
MKVLTVFGTRPEAIKMAPLVQALTADPDIESVLCVTAQHREMLDQVLWLFELTPHYDLNIMKPNQTVAQITTNVMLGMEKVLQEESPDIVLVHGDTSTTFATALAAFYQKIPVGHVEAGLRTFDKYSPYPEEVNRVLTGHIAELHFAPTEQNRRNLLAEGISDDKIFVTGNTVIDALLTVVEKPYTFIEDVLRDIDFENKRVITVTCHRRENLGEHMASIFKAIRAIAEEFSDVEIIYPVHMNPKVQTAAKKYLGEMERIHLIAPLQYQPFVNLMARSYLVITDSGGMQEEAPALGKPVLVVRRETERPEAIGAGTVKLAGVDQETIYEMTKTLLTDPEAYGKMAHAVNPYGDGLACQRIITALKTTVEAVAAEADQSKV